MFRFETLDIWRLAIKYGNEILKEVGSFPKETQYTIGSQLREAAISISNNIAEGSGSDSNKEFKNFLNYSIRSIFETVSMLFIARDNRFLNEDRFKDLYSQAEILVKKTHAFRNTL